MGMAKKAPASRYEKTRDEFMKKSDEMYAGTDSTAAKHPESGADAAFARLAKPKVEKAAVKPTYVARDFKAEAVGKTRCVQFEAALMSPALAGIPFNTVEEFLAIVRKAADAGVAYSFEEDK